MKQEACQVRESSGVGSISIPQSALIPGLLGLPRWSSCFGDEPHSLHFGDEAVAASAPFSSYHRMLANFTGGADIWQGPQL